MFHPSGFINSGTELRNYHNYSIKFSHYSQIGLELRKILYKSVEKILANSIYLILKNCFHEMIEIAKIVCLDNVVV